MTHLCGVLKEWVSSNAAREVLVEKTGTMVLIVDTQGCFAILILNNCELKLDFKVHLASKPLFSEEVLIEGVFPPDPLKRHLCMGSTEDPLKDVFVQGPLKIH